MAARRRLGRVQRPVGFSRWLAIARFRPEPKLGRMTQPNQPRGGPDMRYSIERGIAYLVYGGDWVSADVVEIHRRLSVDPNFRPDMPKIIRIERMTAALNVDEMVNTNAQLKSFYAASKNKRRTAFISDDPEVAHMVKLWDSVYQMGTDESHVALRFFTDVAEAEFWVRGNGERKAM